MSGCPISRSRPIAGEAPPPNAPRAEPGHRLGAESLEGAAEILPFAQDRDPGQTRLETIENKLLVKRAVVIFRHAPFLIVIGAVKRVVARPGAGFDVCGHQGFIQSGFRKLTWRPPAVIGTCMPCASSSRSSRTSAKPWPSFAEARLPSSRPPAPSGVPK